MDEVEADSDEAGASNINALPTKYKFKSLRFRENGSQVTSMTDQNGLVNKPRYALVLRTNSHPPPTITSNLPLLYCSKIRHTTKYCRWYRIESGEPWPTLPADTLEIGDLIIQGDACRMAVQGRQGIKWVYVRDGESYPGRGLPDHMLTLRPGKPPAWVTQKVRSKRPLGNE